MEVPCLYFLSGCFVVDPVAWVCIHSQFLQAPPSNQACVLAHPNLSVALSIQCDYHWPTQPPVSGAHMNQYFLGGRKCSLSRGQCHTSTLYKPKLDFTVLNWTFRKLHLCVFKESLKCLNFCPNHYWHMYLRDILYLSVSFLLVLFLDPYSQIKMCIWSLAPVIFFIL